MATPLPRGAGVLTSLVRADGLLVVPAGVEGHHAGRRSRSSCCAGWTRSPGPSSRSARTTSCSTWPPPRCAPTTRWSPWRRPTSARSAGWSRCATGCATSPGRTCSTRPSGEYTLPYVDRVFGPAAPDVAVVRLVHRDQGLMVAPGNPLGLAGIEDLTRPGVRYVNRQRGAGTRVLLDHQLARQGIAPDADRRVRPGGTHAPGGGRRDRRRARPTPAWGSSRPPGRSASTSCRSPGSPTTWWSRRARWQPAARAAVGAAALGPVPGRRQGLGGYSAKEMGRHVRSPGTF